MRMRVAKALNLKIINKKLLKQGEAKDQTKEVKMELTLFYHRIMIIRNTRECQNHQ